MDKVALFLLTVNLLLCGSVLAEERILDYHSDIEISRNGSMQVTEQITVRAEGNRIKRGIYRDFPTKYRDRYGNRYTVGFDILEIKRDGIREAWHTNQLRNGIRVYIGKSDQKIPPGTYTYNITYRTNRQLGYFEKHDELYWNVTGNDWAFPIERASARISLPRDVPADSISMEAYTGPSGSRTGQYNAMVNNNRDIYFETETELPPGHGFTIVTGWPKGYVLEPTREEKLQYFISDNRQIIDACIALLVLLFYYGIIWRLVGRDPDSGVIVPLYEPPAGYSPASMRYIRNMDYDNTCFATAIINLAVKGYLTITDTGGKFKLEKTGKDVKDMAAGEHAVAGNLFRYNDSITLQQGNHRKISKAVTAHKNSLKLDYEKQYFVTNRLFFIIGVILTIVLVTGVIVSGNHAGGGGNIFFLVWLAGWTAGLFALLKTAWVAWLNVRNSGWNLVPALFISFFSIPFIAAEIFVIRELAQSTSYFLVFLIILMIAVNWLFYELLKAPTRAGRELLDKVEGFKNYIELAEKQELDARYTPGRTPELFEQYLPFAMALGIEQQWAEHFSDVFDNLQQSGTQYSPDWYWHHGGHIQLTDIGQFASSFSSSLSSAVAASSTAPGSSSGSGGGGFSGGGGGGGGGGGW